MADNKVKIDSGELLSSLECSVCCSEYSEPVLAKCGHTFCKPCIEECINRNHECPECKRALAKDDIMKNFQIERLQRQIHDLHVKEKKDIVENILALEGGVMKSPIVSIFQANLKDSLMRFEHFGEEAKKDMEESKKKCKAKYGKYGSVVDQSMILRIKNEEYKEQAYIEMKYKITMDYLLKAYQNYLKDVLPNPCALPIKLTIVAPSKGVHMEGVNLHQQDTLRDVRILIEKQLASQSNPVVKLGADITFVIKNAIQGNLESENTFTNEMLTLAECKIYPGSIVNMNGTIVCESDVPKPCITLKFSKEAKKAYNYYSCETCGLNWICEPCIQQCHKGHEFKDYLRSHVPAWACCYCVKKKCLLPNKNNPLGTIAQP